jgi:hypothetical protein
MSNQTDSQIIESLTNRMDSAKRVSNFSDISKDDRMHAYDVYTVCKNELERFTKLSESYSKSKSRAFDCINL